MQDWAAPTWNAQVFKQKLPTLGWEPVQDTWQVWLSLNPDFEDAPNWGPKRRVRMQIVDTNIEVSCREQKARGKTLSEALLSLANNLCQVTFSTESEEFSAEFFTKVLRNHAQTLAKAGL
jgi:hypothetical protein